MDLEDPSWLLADYLPEAHAFRFVRATLDAIGKASFLDHRLQVAGTPVDIPVASLPSPLPPRLSFLFHTAFCGSTLLARVLHNPPDDVSLKEPQVLLSLALAARRPDVSGWQTALDKALGLLARPWAPMGRVLIKPTNQANSLICDMLRRAPDSRAVLLYSDLRQFLASSLKKLPIAEERVRWMAQHLLVGTRLLERLAIDPTHKFNLIESCALTWYAQMERYSDALDTDQDDNVRSLAMDSLLADPYTGSATAAQWLGLRDANLESRVSRIFSLDSKFPGKKFEPEDKRAQDRHIEERFGDLMDRAIEWSDRTIAPVAKLPSNWKPLF